MSEINLCWIDDSAEEMYLIMQHVFPSIWNEGYSCKTILFGNAYCSRESEAGPKDEDRAAFELDLENFFAVYCQSKDDSDWKERGDTFREKKHLLPSPSISLVPIQSEETDVSSNIALLAKKWMDHNKLKKIKAHPQGCPAETQEMPPAKTLETTLVSNQDIDMSVDNLIATFDIPPTAVVALDICLLYDDHIRIKEGFPTISMALYAKLSKKHHCYLYSGMSIARSILDRWVETYQQLFGEKKDVKIYPKPGLTTKEVTDAKKDLIDQLRRKKQGGSQ